jgi:outer membrane usher protein
VPADRSGVVVKFGVAENPKAALITFVDEEKKPIGVGAIARLDTSSDTFIVGYDGQAYLRGLAARNSVTIERPDGGSCHAEFSYTPQPGQQVTIGNVICR